jgi:hypothetical protein
MSDVIYSVADDPRLGELEQGFRGDVLAILEELAGKGWQPRIASGYRTAEQQADKMRRGLSRTLDSAHRTGRAADIIDRRYGWRGPAARREFGFWDDLGSAARRRGLTWGGDWQQAPDVAHVQDDRAIDGRTWIREEAQAVADAPADLPAWISLGGGCSVTYQLRRRHLRGRPTPFDWIRTPVASVLALLDGGFAEFLVAGDVRVCEGPPRVLRARRLDIVFPHDHDRFVAGGIEALRRHFAPRIAAMEQALTRRAHAVLVRRGLDEADAAALRAILRRRYPRLGVTIVGVDDRASASTIERRGDLLRVATTGGGAGWSGSDAAWDWALDAVMDELLAARSLPWSLPRKLLGRDWLQAESTLAYLCTRQAGILASVPPVLHRALIAAEDHRFLRHRGVDPIATLRAVVGLATGRALGGGSTIEQQLYRTLTNRRERTMARKLRELVGAALLSNGHDKATLAACYLASAYFGAAMNGLEQATRTLSLSLHGLTAEQAAGLVARLKYPEPREPGPRRREQIVRRTRWVLERMMHQGDEAP